MNTDFPKNPIPEDSITKTHCDLIIEQAAMIKGLLCFHPSIVHNYKQPALRFIKNMKNSLNELEAYFEEQ